MTKAAAKKSEFVREYPRLTPAEVADMAKSKGLEIDAQYVRYVRSYDLKKKQKGKPVKKASRKPVMPTKKASKKAVARRAPPATKQLPPRRNAPRGKFAADLVKKLETLVRDSNPDATAKEIAAQAREIGLEATPARVMQIRAAQRELAKRYVGPERTRASFFLDHQLKIHDMTKGGALVGSVPASHVFLHYLKDTHGPGTFSITSSAGLEVRITVEPPEFASEPDLPAQSLQLSSDDGTEDSFIQHARKIGFMRARLVLDRMRAVLAPSGEEPLLDNGQPKSGTFPFRAEVAANLKVTSVNEDERGLIDAARSIGVEKACALLEMVETFEAAA